MLCVHRGRISAGHAVGPFFRYRYPRGTTLRQNRYRHGDSQHERKATAATPASPPAPHSLVPQQDLFPTEFSEYIQQDAPTYQAVTAGEKQGSGGDATWWMDPEASPVEEEQGGQERATARSFPLNEALNQMLSVFLPSHAKENKVDLSYTNPLLWEVNTQTFHEPAAVDFRSADGLRKLLADYLLNVEPHLHESPSEEKLLDALQSTFCHESLQLLEKIGHDVSDVVSWAWIFKSDNLDLAFARYISLATQKRKTKTGRIPKFVPLQLLRASEVGAYALKGFIKSILTDLQLCSDAGEYHGWNWITRVCLVVRLLRHARRTAPECFEDVSLIVKHLFFDYYTVQPRQIEESELRRVSHIFNRFLSLISLPAPRTPYSAYLFQQNAQLALVRLMFASKPQVPVTREGYRALIAVQLRHPKTAPERTWAEAKSLSWPPWRQIKMGIEEDLEYPGKESRAIKLLRRMQEAGYTLGAWEKSAAILAGWDTDKSPTIQTRAILMRPRQPWLLNRSNQAIDKAVSEDTPEVWAARIRATRTVREAWASFRSYEMSQQGPADVHYWPYFTMMERLLAGTVLPESTRDWKYLPGDLKETFDASSNPREVIYIDAEVPSVDEFYQSMLRAGIEPGGPLMSSLLYHSPSIEAGFAYIQDSGWNEVTKDVLRHAEKYPIPIIRDNLQRLRLDTLAAFISLLCRSGPHDTLVFRDICHIDASRGDLVPGDLSRVPAIAYASQLLIAAGVSNIRVWNALLDGASVGIGKYLGNKSLEPKFRHPPWAYLRSILWPETNHVVLQPDLDTFRSQAKILHRILPWAKSPSRSKHLGNLAKTTFNRAVYGRRLKTFLPNYGHALLAVPKISDLMLMVRSLVSVHDTECLVALVRWLNNHSATLRATGTPELSSPGEAVEATLQNNETMQSSLRDVLCAIRLFLDSSRPVEADISAQFTSPLSEDLSMVQQARDHCRHVAWPSDDEVAVFLLHNRAWVDVVIHAAAAMTRAGQQDGI
ncbi:hypothetical protein H2200_011765 [Cladophialophora chaetospira]|uniref:Uncharacterized protein n=1 Tax=Cladophialophora chaetospira TaxID=386627 RepID=A0AA38WYP9_9EURO|nr:hypothetical protein H2200_011765 [Cladophialophora chaetospira]